MKISTLVRQNIRELKPYTSARSLFSNVEPNSSSAENSQSPNWSSAVPVLLDANENGEDRFGNSLNRYPDPLQRQLKQRISDLKNVPPANIFLGNGSDEAIDLLLRIFCEPGRDEIITCPPTYGMYGVQANIHGTVIREVLLDEKFDLRPEAILAAVNERTKLLFLCSPNNPTGNVMSADRIEFLLKNFPGIVVVDEAYGDFVSLPLTPKEEPQPTTPWVNRLVEFPNLVVLQTLSKAWALAGARLGMAFASEEILHFFNAVKFPYNVSLPSQAAALRALGTGGLEEMVTEILAERKRLAERLAELPNVLNIYPSDANFLLVKFANSDTVFQHLRSEKIIVRDRSKEPGCEDCLRITVGTRAENDLLISKVRSNASSSVKT